MHNQQAGVGTISNSETGQPEKTIIELRDVSKNYQIDGGGFAALININLSLERGEYLAVTGRSGSGKSTLINMITGIDRPSSGTAFVAGAAVHSLDESQAAVWRGRKVGIVFQFFQLLPTLTVAENVQLPMDFCNTYPGKRNERVMKLLEKVGMTSHADKFPTALSGGERQRVAIARALANDPPLIIADEPTGNLDSRTAESVYAIFDSLVAEDRTLVVVSHDRNIAAKASRTITLEDGKIAGVTSNH